MRRDFEIAKICRSLDFTVREAHRSNHSRKSPQYSSVALSNKEVPLAHRSEKSGVILAMRNPERPFRAQRVSKLPFELGECFTQPGRWKPDEFVNCHGLWPI